MELRLPLEVSPGREATCRAVFGTGGFFPDDARASHCPFVLTSFTGWSSKRCPCIGFLSRGDREIGVLRNVEPPTRPRLECRRDRPHSEVRPEGREPLPDKAGESTLLSRSGGSKGLRGSGAGKPRCSSPGRPGCRGTLWGRIKGAKYRFDLQFLTWDFS